VAVAAARSGETLRQAAAAALAAYIGV